MKKVALALVLVLIFSVNAFAARTLDAGIGFEMGTKILNGPKGFDGSAQVMNLSFDIDDETKLTYINEEGKMSITGEDLEYNINAIKVSKAFGSTSVGLKIGSIETDSTTLAGDQLNPYAGIDVSYAIVESKGKKINTALTFTLGYDIINMDNWTTAAPLAKNIDTLNMLKYGLNASINF